ncbi:uncharacterized protein LOC133189822 [Saccostrea echinata]|uniref:uncharacterized protein LOC133189822 n=1 Tax=Saccostrea echinata TaxID=191078 RepID=UPI002A7FB136|nr:uncharacterized protein LOC133189822 [Saccostrea echinata]
MRRTTEDWGLFSTLEDLDFEDDLALMSRTHQQTYGQQVGLRISTKKTETMTLNVELPAPAKVNGEELCQTDNFIYLGSIIKPEGGTKEDIHSRLDKARGVFREMNNIWRSAQYSTSTKLKLYQSCVVSTLLYESECWRITETDLTKLQPFHTICLRRILRIFWSKKVTNEDLLSRCKKGDMSTIITKRRWRWIGHVLRKGPQSTTRTALHCTPEGKRKRERQKT